ncbi:MAG: hypothetical protein ACT4QA_21780 [Panacagrimonas sp.]
MKNLKTLAAGLVLIAAAAASVPAQATMSLNAMSLNGFKLNGTVTGLESGTAIAVTLPPE